MTLKSIFENVINYDISSWTPLFWPIVGGILWFLIGKESSKNKLLFNRWYAAVMVFLLITYGYLRDIQKMSFTNSSWILVLVYLGLAYLINLVINKKWPKEDKSKSKKKQ
ncbi:MAG: hypothetical protein WCI43_08175 [Candidatus Firestonebacteria bacterium]